MQSSLIGPRMALAVASGSRCTLREMHCAVRQAPRTHFPTSPRTMTSCWREASATCMRRAPPMAGCGTSPSLQVGAHVYGMDRSEQQREKRSTPAARRCAQRRSGQCAGFRLADVCICLDTCAAAVDRSMQGITPKWSAVWQSSQMDPMRNRGPTHPPISLLVSTMTTRLRYSSDSAAHISRITVVLPTPGRPSSSTECPPARRAGSSGARVEGHSRTSRTLSNGATQPEQGKEDGQQDAPPPASGTTPLNTR